MVVVMMEAVIVTIVGQVVIVQFLLAQTTAQAQIMVTVVIETLEPVLVTVDGQVVIVQFQFQNLPAQKNV